MRRNAARHRAHVHARGPSVMAHEPTTPEERAHRREHRRRQVRRRRGAALGAVVALGALALGGWTAAGGSRERAEARPRFAYLPFGAGPRQCIGMQLAMMEMQMVLALLLPRFRARLAPGHPTVKPRLETSVKPHPGLRMTIERIERRSNR